ncbi:unnamed protein product, partial [marine sediment metagenome]
MALSLTGWTTIVDLVSEGQDISDAYDVAFANIDLAITQVNTLTSPLSTLYVPQAVDPAHAEGQVFYADGDKALTLQTDVTDYQIHLPTDVVIRVINKTGVDIAAGKAIRNGGIDTPSSRIKAVLAKGDLLTTAFVIGITATLIPIDGEGWVVANGHVDNIDTSLLAVGGTIALSDTNAGELVQVFPDIVSTLGTVIISNALTGKLFVKIDNLIAFPQATGYFKGQNVPLYALTTTPQDIVDY